VLVRRPRRRPASARTRPVAARDVGRSFAAAVVTVYNIFARDSLFLWSISGLFLWP
jgi:hypothetical protein